MFHRSIRYSILFAFVLIFLLISGASLTSMPALAAPGDMYEVSGAGTSAVNGIYTGQANFGWGGAQYTFVNGGTTYYLCNNNAASPTKWVISSSEFSCNFGFGYYTNNSNSVTPPQTGWSTNSGTNPVPSVKPAVIGAKITKTVIKARNLVAPGEVVTYTLQVNNTAAEMVTGVVITDSMPVGIINTSVASKGLVLTATGALKHNWLVSNLAAGATGTITITGEVAGTVTAGSAITNTAQIAGSLGGNSSSASFTVDWWKPVGAQGISNGDTYDVKMALNSSDVPYMVYMDWNVSQKAVLKRYTGGAWELVGVEGISAGRVDWTRMAFDYSDVPYVVYMDGANASKATLMRYTGGAWEVVGSAGFSAGTATHVALAFDSSNVPYVVYSDRSTAENKITLMRFTGGAWEVVGTPRFSSGEAQYTRIALDSSDTPYVAYKDMANAGKVTVMRYTGSAWEMVGTAGFSSTVEFSLEFALDKSNTPYVAFTDQTNGNKATVMKYTATAWDYVGTPAFSQTSISGITLALDSANNPYVGFAMAASPYKAAVMRYTGSAWETLGSYGFTGGMTEYASLDLDSNDVPYFAFKDWATGGRASMMYYKVLPAKCYASGSGLWSAIFAHCNSGDTLVIQSGSSVSLDVDVSLTGSLTIEGTFNPNGKTVTLTGAAPQTLTGNPLNFYNLVVNKTNKTDLVTVSGKLQVSKKLTITRGKLKSASDYGDVEIAVDGTLELTSAISVSGNWTNNGTFTHGSQKVTLDGLTLQTLDGASQTAFYDLEIASGARVQIVTPPDAANSVTNSGTLSQTQTVNNALVRFLAIGADKYLGVDINASGLDLGVVTVTIQGNTAQCTDDLNSPNYRNRCFKVSVEKEPASGPLMTFYTTAAEDDVLADPDGLYLYLFGSWIEQASACGTGAGAACAQTIENLAAGNNYFLIGDPASSPTVSGLAALQASAGKLNPAILALAGLLVVLGLASWRRR